MRIKRSQVKKGEKYKFENEEFTSVELLNTLDVRVDGLKVTNVSIDSQLNVVFCICDYNVEVQRKVKFADLKVGDRFIADIKSGDNFLYQDLHCVVITDYNEVKAALTKHGCLFYPMDNEEFEVI